MDAKEFIRTHEIPFNDVTFRKGDVIKIHIEVLYKVMEQYHQSKVNNTDLDDISQKRDLLKDWWDWFDKECVAVNCNDEEREEVITRFFNRD